MILANNGEYMGEGTPADVINEICERSRIGLVSALVERIDFGKEYILSFKGETEHYEDREYKACWQLCGQYMNSEFWCKYGERE